MAKEEISKEQIAFGIALVIFLSGGFESYINNVIIPFLSLLFLIIILSAITALIIWYLIDYLELEEELGLIFKILFPLFPLFLSLIIGTIGSQFAIATFNFVGISNSEFLVGLISGSSFFYLSNLGFAGLIYVVMMKFDLI